MVPHCARHGDASHRARVPDFAEADRCGWLAAEEIDRRSTPLRFRFNGNAYGGHAGDTLASALLANGVAIIARSFKLHRPRGVLSAGMEEPNATRYGWRGPQVGRSTLVPRRFHCSTVSWPSARTAGRASIRPSGDHWLVLTAAARGLPAQDIQMAGWRWYESAIRNAAGLGRLSDEPDADRYGKRFHHCDVLIIGAGLAGLDAAMRESATGADVTVLDADVELGGSMLWDTRAVQRGCPAAMARRRPAAAAKEGKCSVAAPNHRRQAATRTISLPRSSVNRPLAASAPLERLWKIRAGKVIVATGAIERPLVFSNNDLPGIMLSSAVRVYANRYAVIPGRRVAVFTNNDSAYHAAFDLHRLGATGRR